MLHRFVLAPTVAVALLAALPNPAMAGAPATLAAPAPASPAPDQTYADVLAAINEGETLERSIDTMARTMAEQLAVSSPAMVEAEARFPGLSAAMAEATKPVLVEHTRRLQALYRPQMIAALKQHLTPPQAIDVAAFFRSVLGRKLMSGMAASYDAKATLAEAMRGKNQPVTQEALDADVRVSANRTVAQFTPDELAELGRLGQRKPHLLKLKEIAESLKPLRLEMENAPLSADEEQRMGAAIDAAADKFLGKRKAPPAPIPPPAAPPPEKAKGTIEGAPRA